MTERILSAETITLPFLMDFINNSNTELNELLENTDTDICKEVDVTQKKAEVVRIISTIDTERDKLITINQKLDEAIYNEDEIQLKFEGSRLKKLNETIITLQNLFSSAINELKDTIERSMNLFERNQKIKNNGGRHYAMNEIKEINKPSEEVLEPSIPQKFIKFFSDGLLSLVTRKGGDAIRLKPLKNSHRLFR